MPFAFRGDFYLEIMLISGCFLLFQQKFHILINLRQRKNIEEYHRLIFLFPRHFLTFPYERASITIFSISFVWIRNRKFRIARPFKKYSVGPIL